MIAFKQKLLPNEVLP